VHSIRDDEFVRQAISRSNIVINMVGAAQETWNYKVGATVGGWCVAVVWVRAFV
jgi:hypothetical protein